MLHNIESCEAPALCPDHSDDLVICIDCKGEIFYFDAVLVVLCPKMYACKQCVSRE